MKRKSPNQKSENPDRVDRPLALRLYPSRVLRKTCLPVEQFDSTLADFGREMHHLMQRYQGIGLAASQVGVLRRVIVADIGDGPVTVVNPKITERSGSDVMPEGCLSLPEIFIDVRRAQEVEIKGWDLAGNAIRFRSHGLLARVLQHEIDHLNGVLIIDHASPRTHREAPAQAAPEERWSANDPGT